MTKRHHTVKKVDTNLKTYWHQDPMKFKEKLIKGTILKRYKRFLTDIELENGEIIVAHSANTGSMKTCWEPGWPVLLSYHDNPKRKLKYSLEMTHNKKSWICVNTSLPNHLAKEAIENGTIKELQGYQNLRMEVKTGKSRIDIKLDNGSDDECFVEVKNVTLISDDQQTALFPDAVSTRGQKHLKELIELRLNGIRSCMLFVINREDVTQFSPAKAIDPEYAQLLKEAKKVGVEILAYQAELGPKEIKLKKPLRIVL